MYIYYIKEMSNQYLKQKEAILKWRENNLDEYREYQRNYAREKYEEKCKEKKRLYYLANKERIQKKYLAKKELKEQIQEYMNILLDE